MNLRIGQAVRIEVQGEGHVELDGTVLLVSDKELMLNFPRHKVLPFVKVGARAVLRAWDHLGMHQAKIRVTRVTKVPLPGVMVLTVPRTYQTIQKRNYFRLETSLVLRFWVGPAPGPENATMASRAITDDVSAGGVRFKILESLTVGQLLFMAIDFPRGEKSAAATLSFAARVVRVTSTTVEDEVQYSVSCQFENVRDRDRDQMVKLLLDLQSKVR